MASTARTAAVVIALIDITITPYGRGSTESGEQVPRCRANRTQPCIRKSRVKKCVMLHPDDSRCVQVSRSCSGNEVWCAVLGISKNLSVSLYGHLGGCMSDNPPIEFAFPELRKWEKGAAPYIHVVGSGKVGPTV